MPEPDGGGVDIGGALTRKLGPLPAWGWGVAIGGGLLAVKFMRGGQSGTPRETLVVPTGAPQPAPDFVSDLGTRINDISDRLDYLIQNPNNNQSGQNVGGSQNPPPSLSMPKGRAGVYAARFFDLIRADYGVEAYRRLISRLDRRGETARQTERRIESGTYSERTGETFLRFLMNRGGFSAARAFAAANKRTGETTAHAFNRLFGTPISSVRPPSTSGQ